MPELTAEDILWQGIPKDVLQTIRKGGYYFTLPEGEYLFRKGDIPDCMYVLIYGELDILDMNKDGEEPLLATLTTGAVTGEIGLFTKAPRQAGARARSTCLMLKIDELFLTHLIGKDSEVMTRFFLNIIEILGGLIRKLSAKSINS
jgi:CRP/FNR family cyclic AMP-dependent transcriptional regulator